MCKKILLPAVLTALSCLHCLGQVNINVTSPSATDFVKYERIPVSYFNGLPNIEIPLYTVETKDLKLPVYLSYYASGIRVNQYPTYMGLGWNLNAGGCITRAVNGIPDETCREDVKLNTGTGRDWDPGYYFSSGIMDSEDWASEANLGKYANTANRLSLDTQPDEFVINAYGVNGSVYFYRDKDGNVNTRVKSNNGESFRVEIPVMLHNPADFTFPGGGDRPLKSYRIYELFYEFTVVKNDGTKLIFGGSDDSIEFYTEKTATHYYASENTSYCMKTWPTAWMLREVISPNGNKITFTYKRSGSPIIISDVRKDLLTYSPDGSIGAFPSQDPDTWKSFIVQHPVYPKSIVTDNGLQIDFYLSRAYDLSTVGKDYVTWLKSYGFSNNEDNVCYESSAGSLKNPYEPHNFSQKLDDIRISFDGNMPTSFYFSYIENKEERLKLDYFTIVGHTGSYWQRYGFSYNPLKLPPYNSPVTDNWGYWNNKNYRQTNIENDFFDFRSSNEYYTKAEILTGISYPTKGSVEFEYELNDYSKIATQAPYFEIKESSGKTGGLRIRRMTYNTDSTSYTHSFEYKNEDGTSSGILSGIPVYTASGANYYSYYYKDWWDLTHFQVSGEIRQRFKMWSEAYINSLGLTSGNHVTYSRVRESIADEKPLVKEYRYTNHDTCRDTADFNIFTNISNMSLDNEFTSRALMRGLLTDEIWYSNGNVVKEVKNSYNSNPARMEDYVKSAEQFTIPGIPGYLVDVPFVRLTPYKILTFYPYLESRTETTYDPSGQNVISCIKEHYTYNSNLMPIVKTSNLSNGDIETATITYPDNYTSDIFKTMTGIGMVSAPVETVVYKNGAVTSGSLTEYNMKHSVVFPYRQWELGTERHIDSTSFVPYNGSSMDGAYVFEHEIEDIDTHGNPLRIRTADGMPTSYQWDYLSTYPVMIASNAENTYKEATACTPVRVSEASGTDELLYEGFESWESDNVYPFGYNSSRCFVGKYTIYLDGESDRKYILDYRVYLNGRWEYIRKPLPSRSYTINEGRNPIDDVRVWPKDAGIETYSWYPFVGLRSRTDGGGVTESYGYNTNSRLMFIKDNSGNATKLYGYNYIGGSPMIRPPRYISDKMSMEFQSRLCDGANDYLPIPIAYTVPAGKYISEKSREDANMMAFDDLIKNGQKYADENGKCERCIVISIYNTLPEALTLEYSWGVQSSIKYIKFAIQRGRRIASTGDVQKDFEPTVIYLPRQNYRNALMTNSEGDHVPFVAESGYMHYDFFYNENYYPGNTDTYIVQ